MKIVSVGLLAFASMSVGGCVSAPEYAEINKETKTHYGYLVKQLEDHRYNVLVRLPEIGGSKLLAHAFWDRTAVEICRSNKYDKNIYRAHRPTVRYQSYGGRPGDFYLEGYLTCDEPLDHSVNDQNPQDEANPSIDD